MTPVPNALRLVSMVLLLCTMRLDGAFQAAWAGSGLVAPAAAGAGVSPAAAAGPVRASAAAASAAPLPASHWRRGSKTGCGLMAKSPDRGASRGAPAAGIAKRQNGAKRQNAALRSQHARTLNVAHQIIAQPQRQRRQRAGRVVAGVVLKHRSADHEQILRIPMLQVRRDDAGCRVRAHRRAAGDMRALI